MTELYVPEPAGRRGFCDRGGVISELVDDPVTDPAAAARGARELGVLDERIARCTACPRLVEWREQVAREKRAAFRDQTYWGRPVPGFGPPDAAIAVVGLAPAAHGANRTGRMFTGDRSGDVLYRAMHDVGLASQPHAHGLGDGLVLHRTRITSPVRCAPPANKPTPAERDTCRPWLARELVLLRDTVRVVLVLGGFGWQAVLPVLHDAAWAVPSPRPKFGHGAEAVLPARDGGADLNLLGCYHVSQQNTFTGTLTPEMLRDVLRRARELAGI
ncbi:MULTISPECIES: uracil-DNA glycosylase [Saccharopolyspora]|uniref:Type-5 uracil-DNA glycosylase n=1 Tax=Saccharopolyspora gregorii TaxID=33914 RepID=A0ABP6S1L5_9PSEU|nr:MULTISPECIES: uracil-DNA glycosylase [unclassified Saccharopolyspora]MCA1185804.1 uracil-DNA glycosylase [Saccharopolyspora sp. 6T]MCA1191716.1 uracil-DNA glycosylase [Saccharopolyspora sp. 6V]MCA1280920.1 uracil-DNA glycosylase [Saccharopolyspora sp. 7B]